MILVHEIHLNIKESSFESTDPRISKILKKIDYDKLYYHPSKRFVIKTYDTTDVETEVVNKVMCIEDLYDNESYEYVDVTLKMMKDFVATLCIVRSKLKKAC